MCSLGHFRSIKFERIVLASPQFCDAGCIDVQADDFALLTRFDRQRQVNLPQGDHGIGVSFKVGIANFSSKNNTW